MEAFRPVHVVAVGGTIDKVYSVSGSLEIGDPAANWLLGQGRVDMVDCVTAVVSKDSLDLTDADRARIAEALRALPADSAAILTHGTDTMADTARYLAERGSLPEGQTVVLTGAVQPAVMRDSDALFNLGAALTAAQLLPAGVYVAMNGRVFPAHEVVKDGSTGRFVRRPVTDTDEAGELTRPVRYLRWLRGSSGGALRFGTCPARLAA